MRKIATAGNKGPKIRSDCFMSLELTESGGLEINLNSKVKILFGDSILALCREMLTFFEIENAILTIEDKGALPCVLAARLEATVRKMITTDKRFLWDILPQNLYTTKADRFRRSRLYLPGNSPKLALNAGIHKPDAIILDLEDSVAADKKFEAAILVRNALRSIDFYGAERMVRINQLPAGLDDLDEIIPGHVNLILLPKCETSVQIRQVDERIKTIQHKCDQNYPVHIMPIIESALGVINAYEIATASENVAALAIGLEDYTADLGCQRTNSGQESFYARNALVNAARAAGCQAIDSVFSDVADMDALRQVVLESKSLGFDGMGCIHPRQIKVIHAAFAPADKEIDKAKRIVNAFIIAGEKGLGVVSLGSKMIDPPVVKRAERIVEIAIRVGKLKKDWRENYGS